MRARQLMMPEGDREREREREIKERERERERERECTKKKLHKTKSNVYNQKSNTVAQGRLEPLQVCV